MKLFVIKNLYINMIKTFLLNTFYFQLIKKYFIIVLIAYLYLPTIYIE